MSLPDLSRLVPTEGNRRDGDGTRAVDDLLQGDMAPGILSDAERYEVPYTFNAKLDLRFDTPTMEFVLPLETETSYTSGIQRTLDDFDTPRNITGLEMKLTHTAKTHFVDALKGALTHRDLSTVFISELRDLKNRMESNLNNAEVNADVQVSFLPARPRNVPTDVWISVKFEQRSAKLAARALTLVTTEEEPRVERFLHDCAMDVASAVGIRMDPNLPGDLVYWTRRKGEPLKSDPKEQRKDWYELSNWDYKVRLMFERRYSGAMRLPDRKVVPPSKEWQQVIEMVREQQQREAAMRAGTSGS